MTVPAARTAKVLVSKVKPTTPWPKVNTSSVEAEYNT